jgi:hypothetical protein
MDDDVVLPATCAHGPDQLALMWFDRPDPGRVEVFLPSNARQKQEAKRLRPVAVVPALALLAGATISILSAHDRSGALLTYLGLFGFSVCVALVIVAVLRRRNRRFLQRASVRITDRTIEFTDDRGRVKSFERGDPSLNGLLAWVRNGTYGEGVHLPPALTLFVSDRSRSVRLRGSDWDADDLDAILTVVKTAPPTLRAARRIRREAHETPAAPEVMDAKRVNEILPGSMRFSETHPLTFALLIGFGSAAALLGLAFILAVGSS